MRYEKDIGTEKYLHGIGVEATEKTNRWEQSTKEFYTHDDLGSPTRKYDDRGKTKSTYDYDIFGVPNFKEDSHTYTGYTNDTSTNLMYAQARYYLPEVGRFISEDSYTGTLNNSQSQNRYIYCINNPMKYVDPSGHNAETKWYESPNWQNVPLAGPLVYLGEGVYNLATGNSPSDGVEGWSERTLNSGVNTFFAAAILCDLGVGTGALTFGKGVRHFKGTDPKPVTGNVMKPKFGSIDKLEGHFSKHGGEFKGVYKNSDEYLQGARDLMSNGNKVQYNYKGEVRTGYVKFMETNKKGISKFEFVGTNNLGEITTYHVESGKDFWRMLNGKNIPVINPID